MNNKHLEIKTELQIQRPVEIVFEAIVDPDKMSNYFISKSNGRIEEGKTLHWEFAEFDHPFPVRIDSVRKNKYISFFWDGNDEHELKVEIQLKALGNTTLITITEKSRPNDDAGIEWLMGNTAGWSNFLACLKAYTEYGINLRKGAFDFLRK